MSERAPQALLALSAGDVRCALPVEAVLEVHPMVSVTALLGAPDEVSGVIDVHGQTIGVVDLRQVLGQPAPPPRPDDRLVLVSTSTRTLALHTDADVDLVEAPVEALDAALRSEQAFAFGVARLGGDLILLADLDRFLSSSAGAQLDVALAALDAPAP